MKNKSLALDYIVRSTKRIKAVHLLFREASWADVVRESQEVVELSLRGLLRHYNVEVPRVHDVSSILESEKDRFPAEVKSHLAKFTKISKTLRRDRELAFYGSEDLTPSEFYKKDDAESAMEQAEWIVKILAKIIIP